MNVRSAFLHLAQDALEVAAAFPGVQIHHVHLWQNGPSQRLFTGHMSLETNLDAESIETLFADIKAHLHERWAVTHATLEPEVAGCGQPDLLGRWPGVGHAEPEQL